MFAAQDEDDPVAMDREVRVGIGLIQRDLGIDHPMMIRFEAFLTSAAMRGGSSTTPSVRRATRSRSPSAGTGPRAPTR